MTFSCAFCIQLLIVLTSGLFLFSTLEAADEGIKVRIIKKYHETAPGTEMAFQVYVTNLRSQPIVLVGHLDLPPQWKPIPTNDILIHLMPGQNAVQTLFIKIPEYEREGEFPISYEIFGRNNPNVYDKDTSTVLVRYPKVVCPPVSQEPVVFQEYPCVGELDEVPPLEPQDLAFPPPERSSVTISTTSDQLIVAQEDEMVFVSCLMRNDSDEPIRDYLDLTTPEGWQVVPGRSLDIEIPPHDTFLQIFGIRRPPNIPAGRYTLTARLRGLSIPAAPMYIEVPSSVKFAVEIENIAPCYGLNRPVELDLNLWNRGNVPVCVQMEAVAEPCCELRYRQGPIEIPPQGQYAGKLYIEPALNEDEEKQFILLKVVDSATSEVLYRETITLCFAKYYNDDEDPYVRVPSHVTLFALGENSDNVLGVEFAGRGIIDPERARYIEYIFRLPSDSRNVIYNVDQRLYFGMGEPGWDLVLGDTVYTLSPLTQRYRYGRGIGFDAENNHTTFGAHYTQNTYNNSYNPKEACAYFGYEPIDHLFLAGNYFHRDVQDQPTSNIVTIASECDVTPNITLELEGGKNFVSNVGHHDTLAFRFDANGNIYDDTWFDIERIYAGSAFFGYYNNVNLLSGIVDFPVTCPIRANFGFTRLRQNFVQNIRHPHEHGNLRQKQRQYTANVSYTFSNGASIALNTLLLRATGYGEGDNYNFNQQWGGITASFPFKGWSFVTILSFGRQEDYLTCNTQNFLQRYWCYASKQLTDRLFTTVFYEGGNTNYYDAKPWRTSVGVSLGYRYSNNGYAELFLQRVQNKPDKYELTQATFQLVHTFSNRHSLEISGQYYYYQRHYPSDALFLVSYTIPFDMAVARRRDIGDLCGYVRDVRRGNPVPDAIVNVCGRQCVTDADGSFAFKNMPSGPQELKVDMLPPQLVTEDYLSRPIVVAGGKNTQVTVPVVPASSISGEIVLYTLRDPIELAMMEETSRDEANTPKRSRSLPGIRVILDRDNGQEVVSTTTNDRGNFYFKNLRPGEWTIHVNTDKLPERSFLNMNDLVMDLQSDESKSINFDVLPMPRKVLSLE